jgi:hypothetical protein
MVHHLADIAQTSPAFGVFQRALTVSKFFFRPDFFYNCGTAIILVIALDIFSSEAKTITNNFAHILSFSFFCNSVLIDRLMSISRLIMIIG